MNKCQVKFNFIASFKVVHEILTNTANSHFLEAELLLLKRVLNQEFMEGTIFGSILEHRFPLFSEHAY